MFLCLAGGPQMYRNMSLVGAAILCALVGAAQAQGAGPVRSESVDDVIARVIREAASAENTPRSVLPVVMGARIGEHEDRTRFVVELSDPINIRTFSLSNPNRVVVDMPAVQWRLGGPPRPSGLGSVRSYRYGLFRPGNSRFIIDLNRPVIVSSPLVIPPEGGSGYRVVIDLSPTTQTRFDETAGWPVDLRARESQAERLAAVAPASSGQTGQVAQKRIVVIDPGHGGIDSGTNGTNGLMEKDLVLDEAIRLAHALMQAGAYTVHLTRDSDIYIPLRERRDIARSWHADLFISLHADSNPDIGVRGLSVYTLSESGSDREAAALARKENQSDVIAGVDLGGENSAVAPILIDLEQRDTLNRSSRFALGALTRLKGATDVLLRDPHRSAAFAVLKAPDVPAVLIELGYLSNAEDAAQMVLPRWRNAVADAIAGAVDEQFHPRPAIDDATASTAKFTGQE
jgi:N-acetylmuramoyl-L-alanine amidase